jgi:predicted lipid-binding transport protein (Tim44 family)
MNERKRVPLIKPIKKKFRISGLNFLTLLFSLMFFSFLVLTVTISAVAVSEEKHEDMQIDRAKAWEIVKKEVLKDELKGKKIYAAIEPLKAGYEIKSWEKVFKAPETFSQSWFFFIDDQPEANWQHHCRYVFVDAEKGEFEVLKSLTPPDSMEGIEQIFPEKTGEN